MGMLDKAKKAVKAKKTAKKTTKKKTAKKKAIADNDSIDASADIADTIRETMGAHKDVKIEKKKPGEARHYLMWVGSGAIKSDTKGFPGYPTIESYVKEAKAMGVSKRLNMVTPHLIPGETRVYLAHPCLYEIASKYLNKTGTVNGESVPKISRIKALRKLGYAVQDDKKPTSTMWNHIRPVRKNDGVFAGLCQKRYKKLVKKGMDPTKADWQSMADTCLDFVNDLDNGKAVFGYFTIQKLEYILPRGMSEDDIPEKIKELIDKGICVVVREEDEVRLAVRPRGCGYRRPGGVYAVAYDGQEASEAGSLNSAGPLWIASAPVEIPGIDSYRGLRSIPDKLANLLALEMELGAGKTL